MSSKYQLNELTIEITRKCPLGCLICSSDGGESAPNELNLDELKKVVDEAVRLGVKVISLSGGEPLVCSNTFKFIKYVKKKGVKIYLYTCGNIEKSGYLAPIDEGKLYSLKKLSVDKVIYSIQGPNAKIHDMMTAKNGSFDNLITSIIKSKKIGISLELHFVPTALNYTYLPQIIRLAEQLEIIRVSVLRFVPHGRGGLNRQILEITGENIFDFRNILYTLYTSSSIDIRIGSPFNCFQIPNSTFCSAGIDKAVMRPDGLIFPCVSMKRVMGDINNNIREHSLGDIWNDSDIFKKIRTLLSIMKQSDCRKCVNFSKCKGGCLTQRLMKNENILKGKDPYCILSIQEDRIIKKDELFAEDEVIPFVSP